MSEADRRNGKGCNVCYNAAMEGEAYCGDHLPGREKLKPVKIAALPRSAAEAGLFVLGPDGEVRDLPAHMIISITDPDQPQAGLRLQDSTAALLRMSFWDIDAKSAYEQSPQWETKWKPRIFDDSDARRIVTFVRRFILSVDMIIVHCEAGISRSAGVAGALAKAVNGDDSQFFGGRYRPNMKVYSAVLKAWQESKQPLLYGKYAFEVSPDVDPESFKDWNKPESTEKGLTGSDAPDTTADGSPSQGDDRAEVPDATDPPVPPGPKDPSEAADPE